jgi:hypothetical protein
MRRSEHKKKSKLVQKKQKMALTLTWLTIIKLISRGNESMEF